MAHSDRLLLVIDDGAYDTHNRAVCRKTRISHLSIAKDESVLVFLLATLGFQSFADEKIMIELEFLSLCAGRVHLVPQRIVEGKGDLWRNVDKPLVQQPT